MNDADYKLTQDRLVLLAQFAVTDLDLEGFLERIRHSETMAPLLDPTVWMKGSGKLYAIRNLAQTALEFQKAAREFGQRMADLEDKR